MDNRAVEHDRGDRQEQNRDAIVDDRLEGVDDDERPVRAL
jgi:hypothetical protein